MADDQPTQIPRLSDLIAVDLWDEISDQHLPADLRADLAALGLLNRLEQSLGGNSIFVVDPDRGENPDG